MSIVTPLSSTQNFSQYIVEHNSKEITVGKSGANVYELDNNCIAKHICRHKIHSNTDWNAYKHEAQFYSSFSSEQFPFLPRVYHCIRTDDEIQLIMEKYYPLNRNNIDNSILEKVFAVLAQIHNMPLPRFLSLSEANPTKIEESEINQYLSGWLEVTNEHGQTFSESDLITISENINEINQQLSTNKQMCCHGDFHFDNILTDLEGNIIVCDWQNVNIGHASADISFFISRLSADGIIISKEKAIEMYCRSTTASIPPNEIELQMRLANLNTSFIHWHNYLHGASKETVHRIWIDMIKDAEYLYFACRN